MKPAVPTPITTSKPRAPALLLGWVCPKCGAVMAPIVLACVNCRPPLPVTC